MFLMTDYFFPTSSAEPESVIHFVGPEDLVMPCHSVSSLKTIFTIFIFTRLSQKRIISL